MSKLLKAAAGASALIFATTTAMAQVTPTTSSGQNQPGQSSSDSNAVKNEKPTAEQADRDQQAAEGRGHWQKHGRLGPPIARLFWHGRPRLPAGLFSCVGPKLAIFVTHFICAPHEEFGDLLDEVAASHVVLQNEQVHL
jgi:hypothetical protein